MMRMLRTGLMYFLTSLLTAVAGFQTIHAATVSGIVTDAETADPLSYANVVLRGTQQGATTDERGYYVIQNVSPGEYTLAVSYIGYAQMDTTINVRPEENVRVDFQLQPQSIGGEEVVVTANRLQFEKEVETSKLNLSTKELEIAPAFVEADLFRTIQTLPGVISQNDFSAALVVRGGSPDENLILLDGIEVYNPYHFGGIFSAFNTDAIRDADFQSGGFPVRYGGRLSSVLEINTKEGDPAGGFFGDWWPWPDYFDISGLSMDISLLSSKAFIEGPLYEGGYFFSARRTYFDAIASMASSLNDTIPNLPYYFYDLQWRAHSQVSQKHRVDFQGYIGADNLTLEFGDLQENDSAVDFNWIWGNRTQSLILKSFIRPNMVLESMVAHSNYAFDVDFLQTTRDSLGNETENQFVISNDLDDLTFAEKLDWKFSDAHRLQMGLDLKIFDFSFSLENDESRLFNEQDSPTLTSLYLQDTWQLNVLWNLQLGVRSYWYSNADRPWFDFRGGFKYRPLEDTAVKGSIGTYTQFLFTSNQDDAILRIVDFWNAVPDYLEPQRAMHYILGVEQWIGDGHTLSMEAYYKPYMNILDINPLQQTGREDDDFIACTGLAYGAEAVFKRTTGRLSGWLSYSFLDMKKRIDLDGDGSIERESGEVYPPAYHTRHILNLVLNYRLNEKNAVGLSWNWSSGQPYTPVFGKTYGSGDTEGWFQPYLTQGNIAGDRNSARFPSYLRGDISYTRQINWFGVDGEFKLQIINFTNHFNVLLYNWDHSVSPSEVTATSMFPIIPTFGVSFDIYNCTNFIFGRC